MLHVGWWESQIIVYDFWNFILGASPNTTDSVVTIGYLLQIGHSNKFTCKMLFGSGFCPSKNHA